MNNLRLVAISFQRFLMSYSTEKNFDDFDNYFVHHYMRSHPVKLENISLDIKDSHLEIDKEYQELNIKLADYLNNFDEENAGKAESPVKNIIMLSKPILSSLIKKRASTYPGCKHIDYR